MVSRVTSQPSQSGRRNGIRAPHVSANTVRRPISSSRPQLAGESINSRGNAAHARQAAQSTWSNARATTGHRASPSFATPPRRMAQQNEPIEPCGQTRNDINLVREAERSRRPILQHVRSSPADGNHDRTTNETIAVPINAYERLHYQKLIKEASIMKKQIISLTSALDVAMEKCKDKIPCCDRESLKVKPTMLFVRIFTYFKSLRV